MKIEGRACGGRMKKKIQVKRHLTVEQNSHVKKGHSRTTIEIRIDIETKSKRKWMGVGGGLGKKIDRKNNQLNRKRITGSVWEKGRLRKKRKEHTQYGLLSH